MDERQVAEKLVNMVLAKGYTISIFDGEEYRVSVCADRESILRFLQSTDEERLTIWFQGKRLGFVWLVWGNSPDELIADYSGEETGAIGLLVRQHAEICGFE